MFPRMPSVCLQLICSIGEILHHLGIMRTIMDQSSGEAIGDKVTKSLESAFELRKQHII